MFLAQVRPSQTEPFADFAANLNTASKDERMSEQQRKFFLKEQLKAIQSVLTLLKNAEAPISIDLDALGDYLGKPIFDKETPMTGVGVVTGLAWMALGGDTLDVEATRVHTKSRGASSSPGSPARS